MSNQELGASLLLNAIDELGPARFHGLIRKFGSALEAFSAGFSSWHEVPMFDRSLINEIEKKLPLTRKKAEEDWKLVAANNVRIYLSHSGPYPSLLQKIAYPPPVLYVRGEDISLERPSIALVGSRRCSYYGEKMAVLLSSDLARAGITTVSGLARGIDTHVHKSTLEAGGKTWAVIGSGLCKVYPPDNIKLSQLIEKSGALISEFSMNTQPFPGNFPRRNRIIAGLTLGTVVIEGGEKSGSLITARMAAEEGRDVFAVPGPVTSDLSKAPNRLLQTGAIMVQSVEDILREMGLTSQASGVVEGPASVQPPMPAAYRALLQFLGEEPVPKETLALRLNKEANQLSSLLLEMELRGLIRCVSGGCVLKT